MRPPGRAAQPLDQAYAHFLRRLKGRQAGKWSRWAFCAANRSRTTGSFRRRGAMPVGDRAMQRPRLGLVRLKESGYLPAGGVHHLSAIVSARRGRWLVLVPVAMEIPARQPNAQVIVGVGRGLRGTRRRVMGAAATIHAPCPGASGCNVRWRLVSQGACSRGEYSSRRCVGGRVGRPECERDAAELAPGPGDYGGGHGCVQPTVAYKGAW